IRQVLKQLSLIEQAPSTVHFVLGMVKDKDVTKALSLLPTSGHYYFSHAHIPRAMPAEELKLKAAGFNIQGDSFDDVNAAIAAARKAAKPGDMILVCGSVFLVAEVGRSAAE
ncbi:MAG TPA: bifunctional folylpolyglutamate synthase/dihydrofolate synthase, partial [Ferruginibacter sp.]|nr:bifunctional folylpolyglutamate synthase/dihydrofolate synthase [Ferruginibacter sp.]